MTDGAGLSDAVTRSAQTMSRTVTDRIALVDAAVKTGIVWPLSAGVPTVFGALHAGTEYISR